MQCTHETNILIFHYKPNDMQTATTGINNFRTKNKFIEVKMIKIKIIERDDEEENRKKKMFKYKN